MVKLLNGTLCPIYMCVHVLLCVCLCVVCLVTLEPLKAPFGHRHEDICLI